MKKLLALALSLLMLLSLCACGASAAKDSATELYTMEAPAAAPAEAYNDYEYEYAAEESDYGGFAADKAGLISGNDSTDTPKENPEKIIYSADASLETVDFETTVGALNALVEEYGGYIQSGTVNGANYYGISRGYSCLRSANYTIRVPSQSFGTLMSQLPTLGNVPYSYTYQENVTSQYYDVKAHMEAYQAQEQTLLDLMAKAESIDDIIAVESRLSEVRYQIEALQASLNNWDRQVSYSTVNITVQEVEDYTPTETVSVTYREKLLRAMRRGIDSIGEFFSDLLLFLVEALPAIIIIAAAVFAVIKIIKTVKKKKAAKRNALQTPGEDNK